MDMVLTARLDAGFLGGRARALRLRQQIEAHLDAAADNRVVLDCAGVDGFGHGFVDELISPLAERFGKTIGNRLLLRACGVDAFADLAAIAAMHGLALPGRESDQAPSIST